MNTDNDLFLFCVFFCHQLFNLLVCPISKHYQPAQNNNGYTKIIGEQIVPKSVKTAST